MVSTMQFMLTGLAQHQMQNEQSMLLSVSRLQIIPVFQLESKIYLIQKLLKLMVQPELMAKAFLEMCLEESIMKLLLMVSKVLSGM